LDNKTFTARLARALDIDPKDAAERLEAFASIIADRTADLDTVAIPGFGNFTATKHEETISTDLSTGRRMLLPPQIVVNFIPGSMLKKKVHYE